jgi:hypothetical protein
MTSGEERRPADDESSRPTVPSQERPEDPSDPALEPETLGIDDTDTALATEDASNPAE